MFFWWNVNLEKMNDEAPPWQTHLEGQCAGSLRPSAGWMLQQAFYVLLQQSIAVQNVCFMSNSQVFYENAA